MLNLSPLRILDPLKGPIALSTLSTSTVLGLRLVLQGATLIILARLLGPSGFGSYAALGALAVLMGTLSTAGTHLTLLRDISRDPGSRSEVLKTALGTTAAFGSLLVLLYVVVCRTWLWEKDPSGFVTACLALSEMLLQPWLLVSALSLHAQGKVTRSQLILTLPLGMRLCAALLVLWLDPTDPLTVFAFGHLLAVAAALILTQVAQSEKWPPVRSWRLVTRPEWRDSRGYALANMSATGLSEVDKILAAKLLSAGPAGIYAAASRIIGGAVLPIIAMILAAMPRLFRESASQGQRLQLWLFYSAAIYGLTAGVAVWLSSPYVEPIFGQAYSGVGDYLQWLAWMLPALALRTAAMNILTTLEQPWPRVGLETGGWTIMASLAYALTPSMGIFGLVAAVVCAEWIIATIAWAAVWRFNGPK